MTKPKMERCPGSGQKVLGEDEPDGTAFCGVCGTSGLPMKTASVDGKKQYSVPEHQRRANPFRRKRVKKAPRYQRKTRRDSGRR